jgi:hypothetical protein
VRGATWANGYTFNVRVMGTLAYVIPHAPPLSCRY